MRKLFTLLYTAWIAWWFVAYFILLFPFFFVIAQRPQWHKHVYELNKIWAVLLYSMGLFPWEIVRQYRPQKGKPVVFCPNHASYLDIPIMGLSAPEPIIFVGKHSLNKIPLFGYMFRKIHIPVNRGSKISGYQTVERAKQVIERGDSVLFFPEGGIPNIPQPGLKWFKDGAFRLAIEKQIPIIPVTIPYNWYILPEHKLRFHYHRTKIVYHEPISTEGLTFDDLDSLKERVYRVIADEMHRHFPEQFKEFRP